MYVLGSVSQVIWSSARNARRRELIARHAFLRQAAAFSGAAVSISTSSLVAAAAPALAAPIPLGSRRELFIDDLLIERLAGKAEQRLRHPQQIGHAFGSALPALLSRPTFGDPIACLAFAYCSPSLLR